MLGIVRWILVFALFALVHGLQAQGSFLSWGDQVAVGAGSDGLQRPRISMNGSGQAVVVWGNASPIELRAAVGGGGGFSPSALLNPTGVEPWSTTWAGADMAAEGDNVFAVYSTGGMGVGAIYCVTSTDGGLTWGDTARVAPLPGLEARFPTVIGIPGSGPVVLYMEFDPGWVNARYVAARSLDGGLSFQPPVPVSAPHAPDEVCDCCTGAITAAGSNVAALFRNNDANLRTIWGTTSTDAGAGFTTGAELDPTAWTIGACPSSGPDAYIAGDSIRYVWMSGADAGTKAYIGSAHIPDLATGPAQRIHLGPGTSTQQNYPRIAGNGDTLGVVWQQSAGGQQEILFSWSTTGLAGLSAPDTVNMNVSGAQRNPDIAFADGVFHIVWEDHPSAAVQYRAGAISDDTGVIDLSAELPLVAWPSPAADVIQISFPPDIVRSFVSDARGRIVLTSGTADQLVVSSLSNGSYHLGAVDVRGQRYGWSFTIHR